MFTAFILIIALLFVVSGFITEAPLSGIMWAGLLMFLCL